MPLQSNAEFPAGAVTGLIGEGEAPSNWARSAGPAGMLMDHTLARMGALERAKAIVEIERQRRAGAAIVIISNEQELLARLCDEVRWIDGDRVAASGDPRDVLEAYNRQTAAELRKWAAGRQCELAPSMRRGDGRAELVSIETLDAQGSPTVVWQSGEQVAVRVRIRFHQRVDDPVAGIMIRTRIGFEVYGTNTELERVKLGPVEAGQERVVTFRFPCRLCAQEYTLTAASHDPNGVWHDWLEDAAAFSVADSRYTAGVANLAATVEVS
jgi:lipopolysaccharide transport system ATP-binding protein